MERKQKNRKMNLIIAKRDHEIKALNVQIEALNNEINNYRARCVMIEKKIHELVELSLKNNGAFRTEDGETIEDLNQRLSILKDYTLPKKEKRLSKLIREYYNLVSKNQKALMESEENDERQPGQE